MRALLHGVDVGSHLDGYRTDHIDRFERITTTGSPHNVDALFIDVNIEDDDDRH